MDSHLQEFNPNHDPQNGEFSSGGGGAGTPTSTHPQIVHDALKEPVVSIGQLSKEQTKDLEKAVKSGVLSKGKGGPYPTIKTVYAAPGHDFAGERNKEINIMMQFPTMAPFPTATGMRTASKESFTMNSELDERDVTTKESSRALIGTVIQLEESAYDKSKGELTVTIIKPGFSKNKTDGRQRYYPASTLIRDHKIFEGAKMFADHQTDKESKERPEGSVKNWVGQISKTWAESDGRVRGTVQVIDPPFQAKLQTLNDKNLLQEMGLSVRIGAEVSKANIEGQEAVSIDSILSNRSVDFVTYAGAGGAVEMMESESDTENDLELATEAQLRQRRPDLVALIESKSKGREAHMSDKTVEQQLIETQNALAAEKVRADAAEAKNVKLQETSDTQVASIADLTSKITEAEVAAQKAAVAAELKTMLEASQLAKLPEAVRTSAFKRITSQFTDADKTEGIKEAISAEEAYIKLMNGPAKVTKMGEKDNATIERKTNLKESFMKRGMPEAEAVIAAAGRR